jgi:ParB/RepB/Spo0J family partition protein
MSTIPQNKTIEIPFNSIFIPEDENARTKFDKKKFDELVESIKLHGLLEPLVVVNGGKGEHKYRLKAGYRRAAALKQLKVGSQLISVTVAEDDGPIKMLVENVQREDLTSYDLAQALHDLETGEYAGPYDRDEEGKAKKYTKKDLCDQVGLGLSHVTNLIRAWANLGREAKRAWKKHNVPTTVVFGWAKMPEDEQDAAVAVWEKLHTEREKQDDTFGEGNVPGKPKKRKKGKGGKDEGGRRTSKVDAFVKGAKQTLLSAKLDVLKWKLEHVAKGVTDKAALEAEIAVVEFMVSGGNTKKFPGVTTEDEKAYAKWFAAQQKAEAEAAEAEEEEEAGDEE